MASEKIVGVIGSGAFGTVISNLLAENQRVLMFTRNHAVAEKIRTTRNHKNQEIHPNIEVTTDITQLAERCSLIFPVVPSKGFRSMMKNLGPLLQPWHILIHATKGLDVQWPEAQPEGLKERLTKDQVKTMSQVIMEESVVVKVGCLAGPNLSKEIARGLPAGTVIASRFDEVIRVGHAAINTPRFKVFQNHDLVGVEWAGVLKNILAIGSGMASGLGQGENARALLITRGWGEMMKIAEMFGSDKSAFMGLSGIGDLIATCSSPLSRNYTVGNRLAKGETLEEILDTMEEVAEGVNTIRIATGLIRQYKLRSPIITAFGSILFEDMPIEQAIGQLMTYPWTEDVDFIR